MQMVREGKAVSVRLNKDLTRSVKRGHAWLYSQAIDYAQAPAGSVAVLLDRKSENKIASGIFSPDHPIPLRICRTQPPFALDDRWMAERLRESLCLRSAYFDGKTTGYRLVAGEGDGLPGLIIDVYSRVAVIKLDGGGPEAFYRPRGIARWLFEHTPFRQVILRSRERGRAGQILEGPPQQTPVRFLENGLHFTADVMQGQKTGFFLDQRDNRALIRRLARGKTLLNLFAFNGGFSVAAGAGGATRVDSVDIAGPAIQAAEEHWRANGLAVDTHQGHVSDCFEFLNCAVQEKHVWDIVVCDPPSFAPNEKSRPQALAAYARLAQLTARATKPGGMLALASCSSHIDRDTFMESNLEALGKARRKAVLLADRGLPVDHPTPLAMPELRYLKFLLFRLD